MSAIVKRDVTIQTPSRPGDEYGEESPLWVTEVDTNRFRLLESNSFVMSDFFLFWGDEVIVEPVPETGAFRLVEVIFPSAVVHEFFLGGSPQGAEGFTRILHELGGEWECDMGGLTMVHVPRDRLDELRARTGIGRGEELLSGFRDWDDL